MSDYPELETRIVFLRGLHLLFLRAVNEGRWLLDIEEIVEAVSSASLNKSEFDHMFNNLDDEGFLRLTLHRLPHKGVAKVSGFTLTDKAKKLIGVLPTDNSLDSLIAAMDRYIAQVEQGIEPVEEKVRKRTALESLRMAVAVAGKEIGAPVVVELIKNAIT